MTPVRVSTVAKLAAALETADEIEVAGSLTGMPMITLRPGVRLRGGTLRFGARGIRLTSDNVLEDVMVVVPDTEVAIGNDTSVASLGTLTLRRVRTRGQVLLLADRAVTSGHVAVDGLTIDAADVRGRSARPHGFGVDALQGAFTLWNRQADPGVRITATLTGISAGTADEPIRGSGVMVAGHGDWAGQPDGGVVEVDVLRTGPVTTNGCIAPGTPDLISGGVYVISGAEVTAVVNDGPVTTLGANDMALGNWGLVGTWTAFAPVTSHGPSGIGFVSFGTMDQLDLQGPVTTHGAGARGFNVYDGRLTSARLASITTHGDGGVGVQVSKDLPELDITGSITTFGGAGTSLVRGKQVRLRAAAVSVQPAGRIGRLTVGGSISTHGDDVISLDVEGTLGAVHAGQGITAAGAGSDAIRVSGSAEIAGLAQVAASAVHGSALTRRTEQ
jgi:hypothetical protein